MSTQSAMLKWTNGTNMEKSSRYSKPEPEPKKPIVIEGTFFKKTSERDLNNEKLMSRYMVSQTNCNPFMANNDYLKDLEVQDNFLTPQNSGAVMRS